MQIIIYITDGGNYMIIFFRKYKSKIALMVFICALVCTVSCLLDFKTLEKQKMPGLEKKVCLWQLKILLLRILTKP